MKITWRTRSMTGAGILILGILCAAEAQAAWPPAPGECVGYIPPPPISGVSDQPSPLMSSNPSKPLTFRDSHSGIIFYVESDGRHLAAISSDGTLLWIRNPFLDQRLCPYRYERPIIVAIEPTKPFELDTLEARLKRRIHGVVIHFDSSQFGIVDIQTGDFFPMGQN